MTPGWGWLAPIGVEFGLLYTAFRRRLITTIKQALPWTLWALKILLFLTAMLVNSAGSFTSVVAATQLDNLSFSAIVEGFGQLPATSQAALIMAVLSAFIIPLVAGDGLAALALEQQTGVNLQEERWQEVEFTVIYRAVFVRYLQQGITERDARHRAFSEFKGNLGSVRMLPASNGQGGQSTNGHKGDEQAESVKGQVRAYLDAYADLAQLSVNQVLSALKNAGVQAGRTTVAEVLRDRKQQD